MKYLILLITLLTCSGATYASPVMFGSYSCRSVINSNNKMQNGPVFNIRLNQMVNRTQGSAEVDMLNLNGTTHFNNVPYTQGLSPKGPITRVELNRSESLVLYTGILRNGEFPGTFVKFSPRIQMQLKCELLYVMPRPKLPGVGGNN